MKILLVTMDLIGPTRNGGIGTAFTALAEHLAKNDHTVHILWTPGTWVEPRAEKQKTTSFEQCVRDYKNKGIALIPLPLPQENRYASEGYIFSVSHRVYEWCKDKKYDAIIVHEWQGIGAFLAAGRAQGKISSPIITWTHSPSMWHSSGNGITPSPQIPIVDALEMMSLRWADLVVSPSRYMLDWLTDHGISNQCAVIRNYLPEVTQAMHKPYEQIDKINHIVFFGRLEYRKGVDLFANAILNIMKKYDVDVTFMGKDSAFMGGSTVKWIGDIMKDSPKPYRIEPDKTQQEAVDFISQPGTLAVMPSRSENYPYTVLEALNLGIPFVTTNVGGIPEMVPSTCMLAEPNAKHLQQMIEKWIEDPKNMMEHVMLDIAGTEDDQPQWTWERIIALAGEKEKDRVSHTSAVDEAPLISVIVPTYNRTLMLKEALDALAVQDYPNYEVIVVDDASEPENVSEAEALVLSYGLSDWQFVARETNGHLCAARNTGIQASKGDFLVYNDDDNILMPHALSTFMEAKLRTGADIILSPLHNFSNVPEELVSLYLFTGELSAGFYSNKIGESCAMWDRKVAEILPWPEGVISFEDWRIIVRAALRGFRLFPLVDPVIWYRLNPQGMLATTDSVQSTKNAMEPWFEEEGVMHHYMLRQIMEISQSSSQFVEVLRMELNRMGQYNQQLQQQIRQIGQNQQQRPQQHPRATLPRSKRRKRR